jgi:hypothetical protein
VAVKRIPLSAHKGDAQAFLNAADDPVDACLKCGQKAHAAEIDPALRGKHRGLAVPRTKPIAEIQVPDIGQLQICFYAFAVELRMAAAVGRAADIDNAVDAMGPQHPNKGFDAVV